MRASSLLPDDEVDVYIWVGKSGKSAKVHTQDLHHHFSRESRTSHPITIHSHTRAAPAIPPESTTHVSHTQTKLHNSSKILQNRP